MGNPFEIIFPSFRKRVPCCRFREDADGKIGMCDYSTGCGGLWNEDLLDPKNDYATRERAEEVLERMRNQGKDPNNTLRIFRHEVKGQERFLNGNI